MTLTIAPFKHREPGQGMRPTLSVGIMRERGAGQEIVPTSIAEITS